MPSVLLQMNDCLGAGLDPKDFTLSQLCLRAFVVFATMHMMIRIAGRRFMAQKNSRDVVLAFLLASMLARAINGSAAFWANIALGFILSFGYRLIAWLLRAFPKFGAPLKGQAINVVIDGKVETAVLRRHHVSQHDLEEDLRLTGNVGKTEEVKPARLERSGDISVEKLPQIIRLPVNGPIILEFLFFPARTAFLSHDCLYSPRSISLCRRRHFA